MPALLLSMLTHLFLSSLSLSYFILALPMLNCLGKHKCMSSSFPIVILNDTFLFPTVQLQVHNENPARYGRNTSALVSLNTKLIECIIFAPYELFNVVLSTWGRKWQPMEDVKGTWYTE